MSLLRALIINLSLSFLVLCLLNGIVLALNYQEQQQQQQEILLEQERQQQQQQYKLRYTSTSTTTHKPFVRTEGLAFPTPNGHTPKCWREVPAVFFQYEKDVTIIGNSTSNSNFNVIEVCCKGWKRYEYDWSKCVPDCGDKCRENGFCLPGGKCQCFDEFVLNHRNVCVPTCPLGCPNGQCYLNGTCICDRGYELDPTKKYCLPQCNMTCGLNEICIEPGKCVCAEGYGRGLRDSRTLGCQPICIPECGFGHCVGPNECKCFAGYQKRLDGISCESTCYMRCENGFCANRTSCVCQNGYKYDQNTTTCLPDCGDDCENGVCTAPGVCRCFNGYFHNGARCEGICEHGCGFYGKCIGPNVCGCAIVPGPLRTYQQCEYGYCSSKGRCRCQEGTTRFINQCISPDKVTTYATMRPHALNISFAEEFHLLVGRHFILGSADVYNSDWN